LAEQCKTDKGTRSVVGKLNPLLFDEAKKREGKKKRGPLPPTTKKKKRSAKATAWNPDMGVFTFRKKWRGKEGKGTFPTDSNREKKRRGGRREMSAWIH